MHYVYPGIIEINIIFKKNKKSENFLLHFQSVSGGVRGTSDCVKRGVMGTYKVTLIVQFADDCLPFGGVMGTYKVTLIVQFADDCLPFEQCHVTSYDSC
jgi:hypothetical protein